MKGKILWAAVSTLMVLSLLLISCSEKTTTTSKTVSSTSTQSSSVQTTTETSSKTTTSVPPSTTQADWWDKFGEPTYGGTLTFRASSLSNITFDNYQGMMGGGNSLWYERLFIADWTLDREKWPFTVNWLPDEYWTGWLAEGWEQTDALTYTVHLREGVRWQNLEPVNGREFVADDVQQHYDRVLGTGSGYTEPNPFVSGQIPNIERVVAIDKYTVQFKFKKPSVFNQAQLFGDYGGFETPIEAPEVVKAYAETPSDTRNAVGTGAWIMSDFVRSTSITYNKNPDYWGYDERHPDNQVPYIDTLKMIEIPDITTALAALRTGKFDMFFGGGGPNLQQMDAIIQTNPEIKVRIAPAFTAKNAFRCDLEPFTDLRVRQALQLAIDSNAIAKSIYGGLVEGTIKGELETPGWALPYDQWPADLQEEYTYNPTKAKELLKEAGYPNGFTTNIVTGNVTDLLQVLKSYFSDVGVEMEIKPMDTAAYRGFIQEGKQDQLSTEGDTPPSPSISILSRHSKRSLTGNQTYNNDAHYDDLVSKFEAATTIDEAKQLYQEAQLYALGQHWSVFAGPAVGIFGIWTSYVKGYSGESMVGIQGSFYYARFWIDQDLKKSLGR